MVAADSLSLTLSALADPNRRAMLARLAGGERTVKELAEPLPLSPPAVTKHLKVLERAGLVERRREAQYRPVKLRAAPLKDLHRWLEEYRLFWEQSLDRLDDYLQEIQKNQARTGGATDGRQAD